MNELLSPMTRIVHDNHGTIDKYMGDAMMAFWGAPVPNENHASAAVQSGMAMLQELGPLNERFAAKGWPEVNIGIGLNTGNGRAELYIGAGRRGNQFWGWNDVWLDKFKITGRIFD